MLKQRLLIGFGGALFVCLVLLSENIMLNIAVSIVALIGLTEVYSAMGYFKKNIPLTVFGYIASISILFFNISTDFNNEPMLQGIMLTIFIYVTVLIVYMVVSYPKTSVSDVSVTFFSVVYIVLFLSHLILLRKGTNGKLIIWIPLIIAWLSDTMAFTFGKVFGRHKLIPVVSPKKTIEGAIGGIIGGAVFMLAYAFICTKYVDKSVDYFNMALIGVLGSVMSQFGDLFASCIKREHNIKDFGNILPGHGGILDRFDSVIVVAPFIYYMIMVLPVFK